MSRKNTDMGSLPRFKKAVLNWFSFCAVIILAVAAAQARDQKPEYARARIINTVSAAPARDGRIEILEIKILSGSLRGVKTEASNRIWSESGYNTNASPGETVIVKIDDRVPDAQDIRVSGNHRSPYIWLALALFILIFFLTAGLRSTAALASIGVNVALVIGVLLPLLRAGWNPLIAGLAVCITGMAFSVRVIVGGGNKFISAASGAAAGLAGAGILTGLFAGSMDLSGIFFDEARTLVAASRYLKGWGVTDLTGLLAAGVIVAALGAVVDVSVTVTSACRNIASRGADREQIWRGGMAVGRDVIASMLNSLALVFLSIAFPAIAALKILNIPFVMAINFEFIVVMAMSALISSCALVIAAPASCYVSSLIMVRR